MPNLTKDLLTAAKFWVACGGTLLSTVAILDGNRYHWVPLVAQAITAVAVYFVPNAPKSGPTPAPAVVRLPVSTGVNQ